ncbi:EthD domain-domain-containing protein [Clohesyomyces aquaticus]|uniref:EthD domain-domain-containing protein n=1 Tax=Clohesyomyces aquaticus TaxID=1231657 RepID=A0A1Y1YU65_9PLEO|nr:EthD domain-domain-containing protein [Clohesyomyces aquaticus]
MAQTSDSNYIQIITYIKRNPALTPAEFYHHWEHVHAPIVAPWADKHGVKRYEQIHVSGSMVPSAATASAPNAVSDAELPNEPVPFDGIALFLVPDLEKFMEAFKDPYFVEVIGPDEQKLIDKKGVGSGILASHNGRMVPVVDEDRNPKQEGG